MPITTLSLLITLQGSLPTTNCNNLSSLVKELCLAGFTQPTGAGNSSKDIAKSSDSSNEGIEEAAQDAMDAAEAAAEATADAADAAADAAVEGADAATEEVEREQQRVEFLNSWQPVTVSSTNTYWYVKGADLFSVTGISKPIWIKTDHSRDKTTNYRTAMRLFQFDCKSRKAQNLSITAYAPDGSVKYSNQISYPRWEYTVPDTVLDQALTVICKS